MSSTPAPEPSYYEVSLTHRQVVVALAVLLLCVFAAFLAGVWLGREASATREASAAPVEKPTPIPLEKLTFFESSTPAEASGSAVSVAAPSRSAPESPSVPAPPESPPGREMNPPALSAGAASDSDSALAPRAGASPSPSSHDRGSDSGTVRSNPSSTTGPFFVQVFSSPNEARARELATRLRRAKYSVILLEPREPGGKFRVRVGPYGSREKAEAAARRLEREHRLQTWITDQP
jgi:cell division septation protein DedD